MTNFKTYFGNAQFFYGKKFVDASGHPVIAINLHYTIAECQCLRAETIKAGTHVAGEIH